MLVASTATAQPITSPAQTCAAHVKEAPDPVRDEIVRWVSAEPRCVRELEVRVTETDRGLLLVATDTDGRVRKRVLPDAQSVAVLVVSWMADDSTDERTVPIAEPPSVTPIEPITLRVRATPPPRPGERWMSVAATVGERGVGVAGALDVISRGHWSAGLELTWQPSDRERSALSAGGVVYGAYERGLGRIDLRAQLGLGAGMRRADEMNQDIAPLVRGSLVARLPLGRDWGAFAGPVISIDDRAADVTGAVGLERRW
ncbi:MAG TPA: hypothetical protein VGC41_11240 [Kofleriaceae bacterium]